MITKGISAGDIKNQVDHSTAQHFNFTMGQYVTDAAAYETIYEITLDLTYVDYLRINFNISANGANVNLKVDGSSEYNPSTNAGFYAGTYDATSVTGDKTIILEMKDDTGTSTDRTITDICLYASEA